MAFPSVKTLTTRLPLSADQAAELRKLAADGRKPGVILAAADRMLGAHGVERIVPDRAMNDPWCADRGIRYVNRGDSYDDTLIHDTRRDTWRVCSWAGIIEAQPARFNGAGY
jgi:hypothetical protein